jgi:hypothetical protein
VLSRNRSAVGFVLRIPRLWRLSLEGSLDVSVTISAVQRNAIYDDVLHDLTGIGDIFICLQEGDVESAQRMRRAYEADLCLLDDLGWAVQDPRERFELTLAPSVLARVCCRLAAIAAARLHSVCQPSDESLLRAEQAAAIADASYEEVLAAIEQQAGVGQ